jgi:hypothetical protein
LGRRRATAAASSCSTGTVCAMLMQASVTDTPFAAPGRARCPGGLPAGGFRSSRR